MRSTVLVLALLAVIAGGCGNGARGRQEKAALKAVAAMQPGLYVSKQFPSRPKSVRCVMRGKPDFRVPGVCTTLVTFAADGSRVVMFRETWASANFDVAAILRSYGSCSPSPGPCYHVKEPTHMHTWEFTVTKGGQVSSNSNYGDPPPQYGVPSS
jgi:hypothetical protein